MTESLHKRRRAQTAQILKMVALGVFLVGIGAVPPPWAIPRIIREITSGDTPKNRRYVRRRIYEMKRRGYVVTSKNAYEITNRGRSILEEEYLWGLQIPKPKDWSGAWYIVAFDIPAEKSRVRIPFIRHLQNLGLIFYQRSIWIYPHPMKDAVRKIASFYNISSHVSFITATNIDGAQTLKRRFKIT
ncbi:MAG: hypothetical protein Q7S01_05035 [bacterium]|nr:hypothetical protein [bacterium]